MSVNGEGLGARVGDWQEACEAMLSAGMYAKIEQRIRAACQKRNRAENERDAKLHIGGGCAAYRD